MHNIFQKFTNCKKENCVVKDFINSFNAYPKFSLNKPRFDQDNFLGRFITMCHQIDPRPLLLKNADIIKKKDQLIQWTKSGKGTDKELWELQKIKDNSFAADGSLIPRPFRMNGYIPYNVLICVGLLVPNPSNSSLVFWQWMNQNHNAAINHYNRPSPDPPNINTILRGYIPACTTSVIASVGLNKMISNASMNPNLQSVLLKIVPFLAVSCANCCNIGFMRLHEIKKGIPVTTESGKQVGLSKKAAKKALILTALSRIVLSGTLLTPSPFIMSKYMKTGFARRFPVMKLPINTAILTGLFYLCLPFSIGVFPQKIKVKKEELESSFQKEKETLYFNKGL